MNRHLTAEQKLIRARTQLLLNHPFFGTLCVRLDPFRQWRPTGGELFTTRRLWTG